MFEDNEEYQKRLLAAATILSEINGDSIEENKKHIEKSMVDFSSKRLIEQEKDNGTISE